MVDFKEYMRERQVSWFKARVDGAYPESDDSRLGYIAIRENLPLNFYPPVYKNLFAAPSARVRRLVQALDSRLFSALSPWVHQANMYLPFAGWEGLRLLGLFLRRRALADIKWASAMTMGQTEREREYHPTVLLGERSHYGGRYLTVPDLAIRFVTDGGKRGIFLLKSTFVSTGFGPCLGYTDNEPSLPINPDKNRCLLTGLLVEGKFSGCHLAEQGKRYAEYLLGEVDTRLYSSLSRCPMSDCVSDLFRQLALAKALETKYDMAISGVLVDSRNEDLANCGVVDGLGLLPGGWRDLFPRLPFAWLTHNDWYEFVRENDTLGRWRGWLDYVGERYLYE